MDSKYIDKKPRFGWQLQHFFFFDGNEKKIAWRIKNDDSQIKQIREHANIYLNKVTKEQSKVIALHVGLFWSIGKFIIKNKDNIEIMIDDKELFQILTEDGIKSNEFIQTRIYFINQLIKQRELNIKYKFVQEKNNLLSRLN